MDLHCGECGLDFSLAEPGLGPVSCKRCNAPVSTGPGLSLDLNLDIDLAPSTGSASPLPTEGSGLSSLPSLELDGPALELPDLGGVPSLSLDLPPALDDVGVLDPSVVGVPGLPDLGLSQAGGALTEGSTTMPETLDSSSELRHEEFAKELKPVTQLRPTRPSKTTVEPKTASPRQAIRGSVRQKKNSIPRPLIITMVLAVSVAVLGIFWSLGDGAIPDFPNPLEHRAGEWADQGVEGCRECSATLEWVNEAIDAADQEKIESSLPKIKSVLVNRPSSASAISAFALILAMQLREPDPVLLRDALGAVASGLASAPPGQDGRLRSAEAWLMLRQGKIDVARRRGEDCRDKKQGELGRIAAALTAIDTSPESALDLLFAGPPVHPRWQRRVEQLADFYSGKHNRASQGWMGDSNESTFDDFGTRHLARLRAFSNRFADADRLLRSLEQRNLLSTADAVLWARMLAADMGRRAEADQVLRTALETPGLSPLERATFLAERVTIAAMAPGGLTAAAEVFAWVDAGLDRAPDYGPLMYAAGLADQKVGENERALESFEVAYELSPANPEAAFMYVLKLSESEIQGARKILKEALREHPRSLPLLLLRAKLDLVRGDKGGALEAIGRAWNLDPRSFGIDERFDPFYLPPQALLGLEKFHAQHGQKTKNPMFYSASAMLAYYSKSKSRTQSHVKAALRLDKEAIGGRLYRAILRIDSGDSGAAAQKDIAMVLDQDSGHRLAKLYRARMFEARKTSIASRLYREMLDENPLNIAAQIGLARCLRREKRGKEALKEAVKALQMGTYYPEVLAFLSQ